MNPSVIDYDDGDLDLWMPGRILPPQLIQDPGTEGSWLKVNLEGISSIR
ncbi:MAG: hypothetical protein V3W41_00690 [Planctomycetota bacterium]